MIVYFKGMISKVFWEEGIKGYSYYIKRSFDTKILENNGIYVWGTREEK